MSLLCLVFPEHTRIIPHPFSKVSTEILSKYRNFMPYGKGKCLKTCLLYWILSQDIWIKENTRRKILKIQKAGPRELMYILYLSSVASIKHNIYLKKYYNDLVSAGMPAKKALIKVAVKITRMMYSMLKYETHYDPSRVFLQYRPDKIAA